MKHIADYKENYDTHIELVAVLKLNQKERIRFARHNNSICASSELYVQLPFGGMVIVDKSEFMDNG